jgi:hypothetical protein
MDVGIKERFMRIARSVPLFVAALVMCSGIPSFGSRLEVAVGSGEAIAEDSITLQGTGQSSEPWHFCIAPE